MQITTFKCLVTKVIYKSINAQLEKDQQNNQKLYSKQCLFTTITSRLKKCCDMCCDFSVKTMFGLFYSLLLCRGNVLFCYLYTFCVYIYVYWSPTRFRYQMMLLSVDHNMTVSLVKHLSLP